MSKYHKPSTISEAVELFKNAEYGAYIAGGHTLVPTMRQRLADPSDLVDITNLGLDDIHISGNSARIGSVASHFQVASNKDLAAFCPGICELAGLIGDPMVRHLGTIGGSIANNDPASDYPAGILGLNAKIITDSRQILADDYFLGLFDTDLQTGEIIVAIEFDKPEFSSYAKFHQPASKFATCGVFSARLSDGSIRVAVTGVSENGVFRATDIEKALANSWSKESIESVEISSQGFLNDIHGSAEYRAVLVKQMALKSIGK